MLELRNEGVHMDQEDVNDHFLYSLPEKYSLQVATLDSSDRVPSMSLEKVYSEIHMYEKRTYIMKQVAHTSPNHQRPRL